MTSVKTTKKTAVNMYTVEFRMMTDEYKYKYYKNTLNNKAIHFQFKKVCFVITK